MIRPFLTVSSGTLASRLLGFLRDSLVAALLGAGPVADAFLVAFQLVNVVRRLFTEGALNAALVPAWLRLRDSEGRPRRRPLPESCWARVSAALVAASALLALAMPLVIAVLAPGFVGGRALRFGCADARLMLPYLAFAGPVTVLMARDERARPLCADRVLAAAVQHRADRRDDRAAGLAAGRSASLRWSWPPPSASPDCCNWRSWMRAAKARRRRFGSPSMPRCAASSQKPSPA